MRLQLLIAIRRRGMTQRQFARKYGFSEPRLSEILRGWRDPREDERERIARALGGPLVDRLFDLEEEAATA